jgi:sucrose-phosphate synthase
LRKNDIAAKIIQSHQGLLDILPIRASKGDAIRHIYMEQDIEPEKILVCGDSGNDEDMLRGNTLGLVVNNYSEELEKLRGEPRIYFAEKQYAEGIIEGIEHYNFLDNITIPGE